MVLSSSSCLGPPLLGAVEHVERQGFSFGAGFSTGGVERVGDISSAGASLWTANSAATI
jgi:hypothetical protein